MGEVEENIDLSNVIMNIFNTLDINTNNIEHIPMPIHSIDEVVLSCSYLSINKTLITDKIYIIIHFCFLIRNDCDTLNYEKIHLLTRYIEYTSIYNKELFLDIKKTIIEKISLIKTDRYNSVLCLQKKNKFDYSVIDNIPNIKLFIEECCVCYKYTIMQLPCNHTLCIRCYSNLNNVRENIKCPICRIHISTINPRSNILIV